MSEIENLFDEEYLVPNVKGAALQPGRDHRSPQLNEMPFPPGRKAWAVFFVSPLNFHYFFTIFKSAYCHILLFIHCNRS